MCCRSSSDHTENNYTSYGAIALGANIIERHYVDTKKRKGPDVSSSMDFNDLKSLIKGSKEIFFARGGKKTPRRGKKTIKFAFPSVVSLIDLYPGTKLSENNIFLKRPEVETMVLKIWLVFMEKK